MKVGQWRKTCDEKPVAGVVLCTQCLKKTYQKREFWISQCSVATVSRRGRQDYSRLGYVRFLRGTACRNN